MTLVLAEYPLSNYASPALALGAVGTDAAFSCNTLAVQKSLSQYVPTWAYEFDDANAPQRFLRRSASPTAPITPPSFNTCSTCRSPSRRRR